MFGKTTHIKIQSPGENYVLWEYDISSAKKLEVDEDRYKAVLCEVGSNGKLTEIRSHNLKLEKDKKYRLFGMQDNLVKVFTGETEFRAVTDNKTFRWGERDFQAKLIIICNLEFKINSVIQVVNLLDSEVTITPERPIDKSAIKKWFNRQFGEEIKKKTLRYTSVIDYPLNLDKPGGNFIDSVEIDWQVTGFEVAGAEFESIMEEMKEEAGVMKEISRNRRTAKVIESEADVLESTKRATRIAKEIEDIKEGE